jgi:hypothetical protein
VADSTVVTCGRCDVDGGDRERTREGGGVVPPFGLFVASVLDGIAAYLVAPPARQGS